MKLIPQRSLNDCGVCSIAMLTAKSYEYVLGAATHYGYYTAELGMKYPTLFMWLLGYKAVRVSPVPDVSIVRNVPTLVVSRPSSDHADLHMAYWTGAELLDPSPNAKGLPLEAMPITRLIIPGEPYVH